MQIYKAKVIEIIQEAPETYTYKMEIPEGMTWEAGANTHFALEGFNAIPNQPNKDLVHHMSISSAYDEGYVGITTRIRSNPSVFKNQLSNTKVEDFVYFFKTNSLIGLKRNNKPVICISNGVAITTFRAMALKFQEDQTGVPAFYQVNVESSGNYIFEKLLNSNESINYYGFKDHSRDEFYDQIKQLTSIQDGQFYLAGSKQMLQQTVDTLLQCGVPKDNIILDKKPEKAAQFFNQ